MNENAPFLGKGWSFPPDFSKKRAEVNITKGIDDIERSLEILITTKKGERIMRPNFGCDLNHLMFENLNSTQITLAKKNIKDAIVVYEPRIELKKVGLDITQLLEGKLLIGIDYVIRATNTRRNIVFPYYLTEGTDI